MDTWEAAAKKVDFQLSYHRSETRREFSHDGTTLTGPDIDNAYAVPGEPPTESEFSPGEWLSLEEPEPSNGEEPGVDDWVRKYISMALQEVVHEGLEWLRVDGKDWINPRGKHQVMVTEAVDRLVTELHVIRATEKK